MMGRRGRHRIVIYDYFMTIITNVVGSNPSQLRCTRYNAV
jgi:hypothetical protein